MPQLIQWWTKHQILLYLGALLLGGLFGLGFPAAAPSIEHLINPVLMVLLYATFLAVPLTKLSNAWRDLQFLGGLLTLNFLIVPVIVFALSRLVANEEALLVGVLLVLLAPCIDYVIVFSGVAGAANEKLLAATPVLMLVQMLLLPVYLRLFVGPELLAAINLAPFVEAFLLLIVVPLAAALTTQFLAQRVTTAQRLMDFMDAVMVPLMMLTLAVVVASQISAVSSEVRVLLNVIPIYVAFLVIMVPVGMIVSKAAGQDVPSTRAMVFSGATRNSLVVLPLALALPEELSLAAIVVVTQTLVELVGMVMYVRIIPQATKDKKPA